MRRRGIRHWQRHRRQRALSRAFLWHCGTQAQLRARSAHRPYRAAQHGRGGLTDAEWANGAVCRGPCDDSAHHIGSGLERPVHRAGAAGRSGGCGPQQSASVLLHRQRHWHADTGDDCRSACSRRGAGGHGLLHRRGCTLHNRGEPGNLQQAIGRRRQGVDKAGTGQMGHDGVIPIPGAADSEGVGV